MVAKSKAVSNEVLDVKLEYVNEKLGRVDATLVEVSKSLIELIKLEERFDAQERRQGDDRKTLDEHSGRLDIIEKALPPLQEARRWLIAGVLGIISMVGLTVYNNFFAKPTPVRFVDPVTVTAPAQPPQQ